MNFIKNGKSAFKICTVKDNSAAIYAAEELRNYIKKSAGVELSVATEVDENATNVIFIGGNVAEKKGVIGKVGKMDLNLDGYVIAITEKNVYIEGQNGRGLIYGVYGFLEKYFNIRFFNTDCEEVPVFSDIELQPCVFIDKPAFSMRSYLTGNFWGQDYGFDLYTKYRFNNEHTRPSEQYGGRCPMDGRGGTHNMSRYVPTDVYMESHPEFYTKRNELGFITIDLLNGITEDGKLDESMDVSVAKVVIEELKKDIIANPDLIYFQFEQEDGDTFYEYEEGSAKAKILEKYGRSGILIRFCNVVARKLQEWANKELGGRKIYIVTFAYAYTKTPPVKEINGEFVPIDETVIAADNLIIRQAMEENSAYHYFHEKNHKLKTLRAGWEKICNKFMAWCYDMDDLTLLFYYPTMKNIKNNVLGFKKMGVVYLMFEAGFRNAHGWQYDLRAYLYSRLMWNPDLSVNALYHDYMEHYYGVAAKQIEKIVAILENYSLYVRSIFDGYEFTCTQLWTYRHPDAISDKLLDRLLSIYDDAEKQILDSDEIKEEKEKYLNRLANVKLTLMHMKIHKLNYEMYKSIERCKAKWFRGVAMIEENKPFTIYNVCNPNVKAEVPDDVAEKIRNLNPNDICDEIDFDNQ